MNLLIEKKVDLVLQGHDHDYQRSKQLSLSASCPAISANKFNPECVAHDGADNSYTQDKGAVFVIAGMYGAGAFTEITPSDPEAGYFFRAMGGTGAYDFITHAFFPGVGRGIMKYDVTSERIRADLLIGDYYGEGARFSDSFLIVRKDNR